MPLMAKLNDGYFMENKAKLVIRSDLQILTENDTNATTRTIKLYCAVLVESAYFYLESNQFDELNALQHARLNDDDEFVIEYLKGFLKSGRSLEVQRAVYGSFAPLK